MAEESDGCVYRMGSSDLLMTILARKVRAIVIVPDWIRRKLVDKEGC